MQRSDRGSTSRSPRGRDTIAAISLCSRTKVRLNAMMRVWSTLLLRMDKSSPMERPKLDHSARLTERGVPHWADPSQAHSGRGARGGPGGLPREGVVPMLPVAVGGFRGWGGRGSSAVDSTLRGAPPKCPDPGQQVNDLSEYQGDRIWSGAGIFPRGFPNPPPTCLNFSLWRDLSVWRIWGGYFSRWRSAGGGVY